MAVVAFLRRVPQLAAVASGALVAGLCLHLMVFVGQLHSQGMPLLTTPLTITSAYVFSSLLLGYGVSLAYGFRSVLCVLFALPLTIALASLTIDPGFSPFRVSLEGGWIQLHLATLVLAYAGFTVSAGLGTMLVLRARSLKQKATGLLAEVLPPQRDLDRATVRGLQLSLATLTVSVLAAATHARLVGWQGGGKPGKAVLAMSVWGLYAAMVLGRRIGRWRGERIGWGAGFGVLYAFGCFAAIEAYGRLAP